MRTQNTTFVRASISFPADVYQILEDLATQKKVSLAWVVRDAAEKYIAQMKLHGGEERNGIARAARKLTRRAT